LDWRRLTSSFPLGEAAITVLNWEWSSRLALTCVNTAKFRVHPQVKRGQRTEPETPYAIARDVSAETPGAPTLVLTCDSSAAAPSPDATRTRLKREDLWEPVSGIEPLTCRLQEARPRARTR